MFATLAGAEPSKEVETLMKRLITLLDWGMFKLEQALEKSIEWAGNEPDMFTVAYDWDSDLIEIKIHRSFYSPKTWENAELSCKADYSKVDRLFEISKGENATNSVCIVCQAFSHGGWTTHSIRKASRKVGKKVIVSISMNGFSCTRKLYGSSVNVQK